MIIDELVRNPSLWLSSADESDIVISSRVRLARNIKGCFFPSWARKEECVKLYDRICSSLHKLPIMKEALFMSMDGMDIVDKEILKERQLISLDLVTKGAGSGLAVCMDEHVAIMINEEDHLRLQAISPGLKLKEVWQKIDEVDTALEEFVDYAYSSELGYLTACPTNIGTGMRASVMMHLSGLKLIGEIHQIINGLGKAGFAVRGLLGEGTEAYGNMFQISNQSTLGESEESIIKKLSWFVDELTTHEKNARARLMERRRTFVVDQVGRAYGLLSNAMILESKEAVDLLSGIRFGIETGIIENIGVADINEIMLMIQPGHIQKAAGRILSPEERDESRCEIVKKLLKKAVFKG